MFSLKTDALIFEWCFLNIMRILIALLVLQAAMALTIDSPVGNVSLPVNVSITANESINYTIPGVSNASCNCTHLNDTVELVAGDYVILASSGNFGLNQTFTVMNVTNQTNTTNSTTNVTNSTNQTNVTNQTNATTNATNEMNQTDGTNTTMNFSVTILSPMNVTTSSVAFSFIASNNATLTYVLDSEATLACSNCTSFNTTRNLSPGNYSLTLLGSRGNFSASDGVNFTVVNQTNSTNETGNGTDGNSTGNETIPRFTLGLNKLPQVVDRGELTDAELAAIIRNNNLNPGVINRLVKTGLLGDESINAILETQQTPPGIFRKVLGFFGLTVKTPKERLMEEYNLSTDQELALLAAEDVQEDIKEQLTEELQEEGLEEEIIAGAMEGRMPPGLAKKAEGESPTRVPPGQAKKTTEPADTTTSNQIPERVGSATQPEASSGGGSLPPGLAKQQEASDNSLPSGLAKKQERGSGPPGQAKKTK